jgi:hypothetical protein
MKFKGELAKPITIKTRSNSILFDSDEERAEISKHNGNEVLRSLTEQLHKLPLLEEALGLDNKGGEPVVRFTLLTLALAQRFVPGFKVKNLSLEKGKGRKKEWDAIKYCQLSADVQSLMNEKLRSESDACHVLATSERFKKRWGGYNEATLKNRLVFAKDEKKNVVMLLINRVHGSGKIDDEVMKQIMVSSFGITENEN